MIGNRLDKCIAHKGLGRIGIDIEGFRFATHPRYPSIALPVLITTFGTNLKSLTGIQNVPLLGLTLDFCQLATNFSPIGSFRTSLYFGWH